MKLVNIGFGNLINAQRVIAMVSPESAPIKRIIQEAREKGTLIDASFGRKTKTERSYTNRSVFNAFFVKFYIFFSEKIPEPWKKHRIRPDIPARPQPFDCSRV